MSFTDKKPDGPRAGILRIYTMNIIMPFVLLLKKYNKQTKKPETKAKNDHLRSQKSMLEGEKNHKVHINYIFRLCIISKSKYL